MKTPTMQVGVFVSAVRRAATCLPLPDEQGDTFLSRQKDHMKNHTLALLFFGVWAALPATANANDSRKEWWHDSLREPYWERACEVKLESKPGEFKREIKCKNGRGATWRGEWKDEFRDGRCNVKLEASRETFKEEVKCDRR